MNRRRFLRIAGSGMIAAGPLLLRPHQLRGNSAPNNRINVGFIGLGGISRGHLTEALADPTLQLTWLCDVDRNHRSESLDVAKNAYAERLGTGSFSGIRETGDFREMLDDPSVDAVFVLTPDHWHALPAILAARAGKDVFCEKPLSRTMEEGRVMLEIVERAGIVTQVGNWQRAQPEFQRLIGLCRSGALGRIERVRVGLPREGGLTPIPPHAPQQVPDSLDYTMWLGPAAPLPYAAERTHFNWRWRYEFAGGQLTDWINHHYDIAQIALDVSEEDPVRLTEVNGAFHSNWLYNTATQYSFIAHYRGGQAIEVSSEFPLGVRIDGSAGWVHADRGTIEHSSPSLRALPLPPGGFSLGSGSHDGNFFDCIRSRTRTRGPFRQAYHSANVAHLANAALRTGLSELRWDAAAGRTIGSPEADRLLRADYRAPWILPV